MAVFPDRIVLKNSADSQADIIAEIADGGVSSITQGEIVLGLSVGSVTLFTKDVEGNIVTLSGSGGGGSGDRLPSITSSTIDSQARLSTSFSLASPSGTTGDLLVACIMHRNIGGDLTPPDGFTLHGQYLSSLTYDDGNAVQFISVFTKTFTSSDPVEYTWTQATAAAICGWVTAVNGTDGIDTVTQSYGNGTTATIDVVGGALTLTAGTWIYAQTTDESYSQTGNALTEITDSPRDSARISGGYVRSASLDDRVTSTHTADSEANDPNHGMIAIRMLTPQSSGGGGGGSGGLVFWGGGDFTTGDSDGEAPDGGEFTL